MSELLSDFSPSPPRRRSKTSSPSPVRFCLGLLALALSLLVPYALWTLYDFAQFTLNAVGNPHVSHHYNASSKVASSEHNVVRSYFGAEGGVESWDLVASLYWRGERWIKFPGDEQPPEDVLEQRDTIWSPWERIFSDVVIKGIDGREMMSGRGQPARGTAQVVIPSRALPFLRRPFGHPGAQLVSTFYLLPSNRPPPSDLHPINSTKPSSGFTNPRSYNYNEPDHVRLPLPYPVSGVHNALQSNLTEEEVHADDFTEPDLGWEVLLAKAPAVGSMLRPEHDPDVDPTGMVGRGTEVSPRLGGQLGQLGKNAKLVSKSWVAMARDTPVYTLEAFKKQQDALAVREHNCMSLGLRRAHEDSKCWRRFSTVGHFESLIALGTPALDSSENTTHTGWRYTPFLTTALGVVGSRELVSLPNETVFDATDLNAVPPDPEPDFTYDWEISFSTVSPVKLALTSDVSEMITNSEDILLSQDWTDTFNSLLHHPSAPKTRPGLRIFVLLLLTLISLSIASLNAYYWYTRTLTTGIAMPSQLIDIAFDVLWALAFVVKTQWADFFQWLNLGRQLGLAAMIGSLALRLDWSWWRGWVPVGVGRRRPTRGERKSARVDLGGFRWTQRGALFLSTFLLSSFLNPPPFISSPTTITANSSSLFQPSNLFTLPFDIAYLIEALFPALWLSYFIPQILLNHRSHTFAGSHRLAAILQFIEELLGLLPRVLVGLGLGEAWEGMDEVRVYDLVGVVVFGGMAWQATRYPAVKQEEEEGEE